MSILYAIVTEKTQFELVCESAASTLQEVYDLREMGCAVTVFRIESANANEAWRVADMIENRVTRDGKAFGRKQMIDVNLPERAFVTKIGFRALLQAVVEGETR